MDSLNSSSVQNIEISSKSTGSNTPPISCASCGSKDYVEAFWQPHCFKAIYPSTSSNKKCTENIEENFTFHQPLFSSPSFFPSFFNGSLPPNFFFANNFNSNPNLNHISVPEKKQSDIQEQKCFPFGVSFHQTGKLECGSNDLTNPLKSSCVSEPPDNPRNPKENPQKSFVQRCACNNVVSWTCSPFIIPMFSYCVLWNSQASHPSFLASNLFCTHHKNETRKESACDKNKDSSVNSEGAERRDDLDENGVVNVKKENQDEDWKAGKSKTSTHKDGSNSSFLSLNSINYIEEGGYEQERMLEHKRLLKDSSLESNLEKKLSEEEILEEKHDQEQNTEDENTSVAESDNEGSVALDEQDLRGPTDLDSERITSAIVEQLINFEMLPEVMKSDESANEDLVIETLDQLTGESDNEELRVLTSGFTEQILAERSSVKKPIKNFTMTDQVINTVQGEEAIAMTVAAAGDLGGAQCTGYRVGLPIPETETLEKMKQETQTEESLDTKDSNENNVITSRNNKDLKGKEDKKAQVKHKSNIAKLSSKKKEGIELVQSVKQEDKRQKDVTLAKKKHNCIATETKVDAGGNSLKNPKPKVSPRFQEFQGTDKQSLKSNAADKILSSKREEKDRVGVVRSQNCKKSSNIKQ